MKTKIEKGSGQENGGADGRGGRSEGEEGGTPVKAKRMATAVEAMMV